MVASNPSATVTSLRSCSAEGGVESAAEMLRWRQQSVAIEKERNGFFTGDAGGDAGKDRKRRGEIRENGAF